ncbi:S8 family serine peptidase [Carboxylicivirga sp. M1479]|uniref:S8 family serine peptidase n=1 Tax=Carboxylicivirga sp. M1479 TaxID=2594476 RepID=UPI001177F5D9|nr:S8 family serine peptidase [Carboxylicivirga sp. M1479]TRX71879.1 S8 family serine peptidase [Carboxylicivirga sp. M1479]
MKKQITILTFILIALVSKAQDGYFVSFTDKNNSPFSLDKPGDYLSQRAIDRRSRQNIAILEEDLPVNQSYVDSLIKAGIDVRHTSKWLNGAIVFSNNTELMDTLMRVSFINSVEKTNPSTSYSTRSKFEKDYPLLKNSSNNEYGESQTQIETVNGHKLHERDFKGHDLLIAVIDAGFYKVDELPLFQHLWDNERIIGTKDFVNPQSNIFDEHTHGMNVLSIIGGYTEQEYIGSAPDASFWLLRSEDVSSEHPIEPDYWICAAEFADSAGVDIINTSLGYYEFDSPSTSYSYADMNGSTRISRASDIAASKGMLIVTSAGNEGNGNWQYIGAPADAKNCLAVGAMNADSTKANFSSIGPSADFRIKPEISAMGVAVAYQGPYASIRKGNGTSFSAPIISGLAACLWQSMPYKTADEIRDLIIQGAHQTDNPDNEFGYGIANFDEAYHVDVPNLKNDKVKCQVSPNPFSNQLKIRSNIAQSFTVSIVDVIGNLKYQQTHHQSKVIVINTLGHLPRGLYIITIENKSFKQHVKVIKSH